MEDLDMTTTTIQPPATASRPGSANVDRAAPTTRTGPASPSLPADGPPAVESAAALAGHPLHPVVVPLPIAAAVGCAISDLAFARTGDPFWARSSRYLTDVTLVGGLLAASLGAVDLIARPAIRRHDAAWVHAAGNAVVLVLAGAMSRRRHRDARAAVMPTGLLASVASVGLLGVTGWLGGELSYRHRIGVMRTR
jgi:uncharacterized membrane protein